MTIPRYQALHRHWRRHPRPEWLIAGYLGYRPPPELSALGALARGRAHGSSGNTIAAPGQPVAQPGGRRVPPPTGALQALFGSLGGQLGKTVVLTA